MNRTTLGDYREGLLSDRSRSRISAPQSLDTSLDFTNPIKALEMRELQEEENWIRTLKMQRDRVSEFRMEIEARDTRIQELEAELSKMKGSASNVIRLQTALEKAETLAKTREKDLAVQTDTFKKQLREYQLALEDQRESMRQDQEVFQREIQK